MKIITLLLVDLRNKLMMIGLMYILIEMIVLIWMKI
jgi:hypothetical protein